MSFSDTKPGSHTQQACSLRQGKGAECALNGSTWLPPGSASHKAHGLPSGPKKPGLHTQSVSAWLAGGAELLPGHTMHSRLPRPGANVSGSHAADVPPSGLGWEKPGSHRVQSSSNKPSASATHLHLSTEREIIFIGTPNLCSPHHRHRPDEMHNHCAIFAPDGTYQQSDQIAGMFHPEQK